MNSMMHNITVKINDEEYKVSVESKESVLDMLRDKLGLTGTKKGCGKGDCGACTVLLNGKAVNSCLVLAVEADGQEITTIEGVSKDSELTLLQENFLKYGAVQCGNCSPGMIMSAKALISENSKPNEEEIKEAISGNLCRCTGYTKIVEAIKQTVEDKE